VSGPAGCRGGHSAASLQAAAAAAAEEECVRLRLERADERRRREAAEREVVELRRRLRRAADETRFWREKCEDLEATSGLLGSKPPPRAGAPGAPTSRLTAWAAQAATGADEAEEEEPFEEELAAIESVVDQLCSQRAAFAGDLDEVRRQLSMALELSGG